MLFLHIVALFFLLFNGLAFGIVLLSNFGHITSFSATKSIVIINCITLVLNFVVDIGLAFVLYRTSQKVSVRQVDNL